jgi:hypothetical protein
MRWARCTCWRPRGSSARNRRSSTCPPIRCTATGPIRFLCGNWRPAGITPTRPTRTAYRRIFHRSVKHSLFGASKVAGDVMVQEYGRYFNMPTCCLRGGCLTGPNHSGVELHGFLSYLIKCNVEGREYKVYGYKGQAGARQYPLRGRGAFHVRVLESAARGGGVQSGRRKRPTPARFWKPSAWPENVTGRPMRWRYLDENRIGDHICYYSDLT